MQDYYAQIGTKEIEVEDRVDWLKARCKEAHERGHHHGLRATIFEYEELIILEGWAEPLREYPEPFIHKVPA